MHANAVSFVAEKSGCHHKSLLRKLELHLPVRVRGSLKHVLLMEAEQVVVAMCEFNSLADTPLCLMEVKASIEHLTKRKV